MIIIITAPTIIITIVTIINQEINKILLLCDTKTFCTSQNFYVQFLLLHDDSTLIFFFGLLESKKLLFNLFVFTDLLESSK